VPPATAGFFPLDEQMGLCEGRWSEGLVREAVWLSGQTTFVRVEGILQRLRGLSIGGHPPRGPSNTGGICWHPYEKCSDN